MTKAKRLTAMVLAAGVMMLTAGAASAGMQVRVQTPGYDQTFGATFSGVPGYQVYELAELQLTDVPGFRSFDLNVFGQDRIAGLAFIDLDVTRSSVPPTRDGSAGQRTLTISTTCTGFVKEPEWSQFVYDVRAFFGQSSFERGTATDHLNVHSFIDPSNVAFGQAFELPELTENSTGMVLFTDLPSLPGPFSITQVITYDVGPGVIINARPGVTLDFATPEPGMPLLLAGLGIAGLATRPRRRR